MEPRIRLATRDDASQVQAIYAPFCEEDSHVSFEIAVPSVAEIAGRIDRTLERFPWLVAVEHGVILGYAYAGPHGDRAGYLWSVSTAIYIQKGRRRSGVGRGLYSALLAILRLQGFASAFAGTTLPNPASIGLHRAVGFTPVGEYRDVGYVGGRWLDTAWWQVSLRGRMPNPDPPRGINEVVGTPWWDEALALGAAQLRPDTNS